MAMTTCTNFRVNWRTNFFIIIYLYSTIVQHWEFKVGFITYYALSLFVYLDAIILVIVIACLFLVFGGAGGGVLDKGLGLSFGDLGILGLTESRSFPSHLSSLFHEYFVQSSLFTNELARQVQLN
jgi:hypothetical protein